MVTKSGRAPTGQALAVPVEPASSLAPSRLLMAELDRGIVGCKDALDATELSDTFWYRYWSGYLKAYESLRDKLRAAIAMEAAKPPRRETCSARKGDSAGPKDIAPKDAA